MHPAKLPTAVGCSQRDPGPWHKLGATLDLCPLCLGSGQPKVPCGLADGSAMLFIAAQNPASAQAPSVPVGTLRSIGSVVKYKNTRAMHIFKKEKKKTPQPNKKPKTWLAAQGCARPGAGNARLGKDGSCSRPLSPSTMQPWGHTCLPGALFLSSNHHALPVLKAFCSAWARPGPYVCLVRLFHRPKPVSIGRLTGTGRAACSAPPASSTAGLRQLSQLFDLDLGVGDILQWRITQKRCYPIPCRGKQPG